MTTAGPIRLLVAEDHFLARFALVAFLRDQRDMVVVAKAETGPEAVARAAQHRPDVVLMDLDLPGCDGIAAMEAIRRARPETRVLVISNLASRADVQRAIRAGARGYVRKDVSSEALVDAVRRVHAGHRYFPLDIADKIVEQAAEVALTAREGDVLAHLVTGASNKEIAAALSIGEGTVRIYVSNLLAKLQVKTRTEAAVLALQRGLVKPARRGDDK